MAANRVSLLFDIFDGTGSQVNYGHATCTLTTQAVDAPGRMVITSGPVQVPFNVPGTPSKLLLANDSPGPVPQGSAWNLKFAVPGIASCTVQLFAGPVSFTATGASPAVFTWTPAGYLTSLPNGTGVQLSGSSLPGGFSPGVTYFVTGANGTTFQLTSVQGNPPAASTSSGSGTLTVVQYNLSALTQVLAGPVVSPLMTAPSGTPSAGQVPVATGVGGQSAWGAASGGGGSAVQIGGDLSGTPAAPVVEKIQGTPIEAPTGSGTQYLDGNGNWTTPEGTGSGLSNPMTAAGDSLYGGASGAPQRLAGNTAATRKFMRQTGDGTNSAAPAWDTLQAGDLPAATTGAAGAVQLAGDLGGTAAAPLVEKIQGTAVAAPSGGAAAYLNAAGAWTVPPGSSGGGTLSGYVAPAVVSLTYGASITVNAALGNAFNLTLTSSTGTIANPSNAVDGQVIRFRVKQDGTGSRTVSWGSAYDFGAGSAPTLSTAAGKVDIVAFEYVASISKWCALGSGLGY